MKFQLMLLSLSAAAALASMSPALEERELATLAERELTWNDVPACKDGGHLPDDVFKYADDCRQKCFGREEDGGKNKYGVCAGYCRKAFRLGSFKCFGQQITS